MLRLPCGDDLGERRGRVVTSEGSGGRVESLDERRHGLVLR